ncbi:MAG: basic amino acid ABC transporter substrate-binding protein [Chloroflexi bacterium]|nr:MAG: basic amino acid ABC transporter substrate-binding protein [Chloroflexota bacterium]
MKRRTVLFLSILVLASFILSACGQAGPSEPVRVVLDATWPPFEMTDEQTKEVTGLDIDLMKAIAEKAGFEIEFINISFDSALAGLAQCQYDASISAISIDEDRKKQMLFSDPYFTAGQMVTVNASNTDITGVDSLVGKKVGAQIGTTGAMEAEAIEGVVYSGYDSIDLAFLDVMNGQIDAVIADNTLAIGYIGQNPDKLKAAGDVFTGEDYGIAVCKEKTELLDQINEALADLKAEGYIDELSDKWLATAP